MKKIVIFIIVAVICIMAVIVVKIQDNLALQTELSTYNEQFETYLNKTMYGADVLTIINKAIDLNTTNDIQKDDDGFYIEDDNLSLKVELILLSTNDNGEVQELTYQMETLEKAGLDKFISSFGLVSFECTNIEYNSVGRACKIIIKQLEV